MLPRSAPSSNVMSSNHRSVFVNEPDCRVLSGAAAVHCSQADKLERRGVTVVRSKTREDKIWWMLYQEPFDA